MTVMQLTRFPLGVYRGLRFGVILDPSWSLHVYLEGKTTLRDSLSRDHHGPRAMMNALNRLASDYSEKCVSTHRELTVAESQLRDYQARLDIPFNHEAYVERLNGLRDQLRLALSGSKSTESAHDQPNTAELAEQIKTLRAGQSVEAGPQRSARTRASAEEPVTARIRRRTETETVPGSLEMTIATKPTEHERMASERFISRNDFALAR